MEINLDSFIKNNQLFLHHLNNNIIECEEKLQKAEYIANKHKFNKQDKYELKNKIKNIRGGKTKEPFFDIYSYVLAELYDIETDKNKHKTKKHFAKKMIQIGGMKDISDALKALDLSGLTDNKKYTSYQKTEANKQILDFVNTAINDYIGKNKSNILLSGPIGSNILSIDKNLQKMDADDIYKLTEQQTISRMFAHLGTVNNIATNGSKDIKSVIDHFKEHGILATNYLNNIVKEIDIAGKENINFEEIVKQLKIHEDNLLKIIKKMITIEEFIKNSTNELKKEEDYNLYPLDVKIVSSKFLETLYPGKKEYYIDVDKIKIQFSHMPKTVDSIVKEIRKRAKEANKKVPGVSHSLFTSIKNIDTFNSLINDLKLNFTAINHQGGGMESTIPDNLIPDMLNRIEESQITNIQFSNTIKTRKDVSIHINKVGNLINMLDTKIDAFVSTVEYFNLTESREHYYSYVMANLALNANNRRKYKYMSFGVLDFYKSVIDTIYKKIDYDKNGHEKIIGSDSKYLFFYHYHYKIIRKLKVFLDKFYELKNLNLFDTANSFIEIADCTGKVKDYLSLLNIYKYLLDDFYAKIGLGKSASNVSVYLRINDFAREKLLIGRQFGTIYNSSIIKDEYARKINRDSNSALIYNVELLNKNNANYLFRTTTQDKKNELLKKIDDTNKKKKLTDKLEGIFDILDDDDYEPQFTWQLHQGGTKYTDYVPKTNINERSIKLENKELYYIRKDDDGKKYNIDNNTTYKGDNITQLNKNILENEVKYILKSTNDAHTERETRRFYLVNREVPTIMHEHYSNEETNKINDENALKKIIFDEDKINILSNDQKEIYKKYLEPLNGKVRPRLAKILFIPLLNLLKLESINALGLNEMYNFFNNNTNTQISTRKLEYTQYIKIGEIDTQENINIEFNSSDSIVNFYEKFMNNSKIKYPLMIGFILYSDDTNLLKLSEKITHTHQIYKKYKNKLIGMNIKTFSMTDIKNSDSTTVKFNYDESSSINDNPIVVYHFLLKKYFGSLFFEQTTSHRDESEFIFGSSLDDKKLVIENMDNCARLLDRYSNEDDINAIRNMSSTDKINIETPFNHVFSSEKNPDNESLSMFMSIPSKLSMGNGFMMLTFGYSGTGKTFTIFGKKEIKDDGTVEPARGILQSTLDEVEVADNEIYFRCYEMYGIGFPYANYWYDKIGENYDPKRTELLIHHQFTTDGENLKPSRQHVFDDSTLKKFYLSNNNWFFPDAGDGEYKDIERDPNGQIINKDNGENIEFKEHEIAPDDFDECIYVGDNNLIYNDDIDYGLSNNIFIPYVKYNNDEKKKYFTPRIYSIYDDNKIDNIKLSTTKIGETEFDSFIGKTKINFNNNGKLSVVPMIKYNTEKFKDAKKKYIDIDSTSNKSKSTYIKISSEQIADFGKLVEEIDNNRKKPLDATKTLYNNNSIDKMPENYKYIKRVKETANNPESSRSVIFYEFVIKLKEMKEVTITDEYGRTMTVWRKYVTLLIVDLPGQEDIKTSFVEKPEYNIVGNGLHRPIFNFPDSEDTILKTINKEIIYTYKDSTKLQNKEIYKDTNTDTLVYKYNELLQKMTKSTLYMNPLFKFITKMQQSQINPVTINENKIDKDFILFNTWTAISKNIDDGIYPLTVTSKAIFSKVDQTYSQSFDYYCNNMISVSTGLGSDLYKKNLTYILDGVRQYQINPFDFLIDYIFDNIDKNDNDSFNIYKALSPYEGYMINENVGSLVTYLFNKTKTKNKYKTISKIRDQQHNFALFMAKNNKIPIDMKHDINDIKSADNNFVLKTPDDIVQINDHDMHYVGYYYPINTKLTQNQYNLNYAMVPLNEMYDEYNNNIEKLEFKKINRNEYYLNQINHNYLNNNNNNGFHFNNRNSNIVNLKKDYDLFKNISPDVYKSKHPSNVKNVTNAKIDPKINFREQLDKYGNTHYTALGYISMWKRYEFYIFKYLFYIEIFLILKKLRGVDKYFRENTMRHLLSSNNYNGKLMPDKSSFQENYKRLESMYNFYTNQIIKYDKDNINFPRGIYDKDSLFRNGEINEYLNIKQNHFYLDRMNDKILVSNNSDLETYAPELEMLNKKPLIYSYLGPYENFFNTYSLLYVMSNNDPHIKCFKQFELLKNNETFMKAVINI